MPGNVCVTHNYTPTAKKRARKAARENETPEERKKHLQKRKQASDEGKASDEVKPATEEAGIPEGVTKKKGKGKAKVKIPLTHQQTMDQHALSVLVMLLDDRFDYVKMFCDALHGDISKAIVAIDVEGSTGIMTVVKAKDEEINKGYEEGRLDGWREALDSFRLEMPEGVETSESETEHDDGGDNGAEDANGTEDADGGNDSGEGGEDGGE
ncbi:MAG: hypothetical protein L6R41_003672 [Letrouitia leprolyta]|nr:MAG: hypothetical protein L6R41_003672 [Letrouitia leprolyta]